MKKLSIILSMLVLLFSLSGCESSKIKQLKKEVEVANEQCPMDMELVGKLTSVRYNDTDQEVLFIFQMNSFISDPMALTVQSKEISILKDVIKLHITKDEFKKLVNLIVETNTKLKIVCIDLTDTKFFEYVPTIEDLEEIKNYHANTDQKNRFLLDKIIEINNAQCPDQKDEASIMTSVKEEGDNVIFYYMINERLCALDNLKLDTELIKENFKYMLSDYSFKDFVNVLSSLGKNEIIRYIGDTSGDSVDIVLSNVDLTEIAVNKFNTDLKERYTLDYVIRKMNELCPEYINEAFVLTSVKEEGDNVIFTYKINEGLVNFNDLNFDMAKDNIKNMMYNDANFGLVANTLKSCNKNLVYRLVGDTSGDSFDIVFTPDEL